MKSEYVPTDGECSATLLVLKRRVTLSGIETETGVKLPEDLKTNVHGIEI